MNNLIMKFKVTIVTNDNKRHSQIVDFVDDNYIYHLSHCHYKSITIRLAD